MGRRAFWFLLSLGLVVGLTILVPLMDRMSNESTNLNSSMSVAPFGYKALYLLIGKVQDKPVQLWQHSTMNLDVKKPRIVWFMDPAKGIFFDGKSYEQRMRQLAEEGHHLIFVLDARHPGKTESQEQKGINFDEVMDYLNKWYGLELETYEVLDDDTVSDVLVTGKFPTRQVEVLSYRALDEDLVQKYEAASRRSKVTQDPILMAFDPESIGDGQVLLQTRNEDPLVVRYSIGKGSVTIFPNSFFFANLQLDKGDNAPLAVALQEMNPGPEAVFEVYSHGFNANRDVLTYLALGKGKVLLITICILLAAFCLWMLMMPLKRRYYLETSDERYFTQEIFIGALADHYRQTGNWTELYRKLQGQFKRELDQKYPGFQLDQQLSRVAASPFYRVTLQELEEVFAIINVRSEAEFLARSQKLLSIQRKVSRHEQHQPGAVSHAAPAAVPR